MTAAAKAVLKQAKRLSPEELAELRAELDALDEAPAWAAGWKAELDRRWAAYESGEEPGEPARTRSRRAWPRGRLGAAVGGALTASLASRSP